MKKPITKSKAKAKAWRAFSLYIRTKDNTDGDLTCYTCGVIDSYKVMDAGHAIPGRNNAVLFMEGLVRPQCKQCNIFKHGNLAVFTRKLIDELGEEEYDRLAEQARQIVQFKTYEFLEIEKKYLEKLKGL